MNFIFKALLVLSLVMLILLISFLVLGFESFVWPGLMVFFLSVSGGVRIHRNSKGFSFSLLVFAAVAAALGYPGVFISWGRFETTNLIVPLLQIIMFGMGTAMSMADFGAVVRNPRAVMIGLICQFTIMPMMGALLIMVFDFPPEIAAGIILVGASPSGLASNVMAYIGKANLALSVTLTTVSTLLAPLITPVWMKVLGDQLVPIDFWAMMWGIVKITIIPIMAGLIFNRLLHGKTKWLDRAMPLVSMGGIAMIITIITAAGRDNLLSVGGLLILASLIHNLSGYLLGFWSCRMLGLDVRSCRTIAFEVGMQNAGLASGLALLMGKVATVGLAPAVFGPMMNITGSSLAIWWRDRTVESD